MSNSMDNHRNPLTQIRARITRKIHTAINQRFHVLQIETKRRKIQGIYFGFDCPAIDPMREVIMVGQWQHSQDYGPQFHIHSVELAEQKILRVQEHSKRLYSAIDS